MHVLLKCPKQDLRLDDALSHHRISELLEASDVSAHHVVALVAIFLSSIISSMVGSEKVLRITSYPTPLISP